MKVTLIIHFSYRLLNSLVSQLIGLHLCFQPNDGLLHLHQHLFGLHQFPGINTWNQLRIFLFDQYVIN